MHEMHVESRSWHVIVLDFALFCGFTLREFKLPECNLVNRIIKITHTHNLHVKMLGLLWELNLLPDYGSQM